MLGHDRAASLTADSMVQALVVPAPLFLRLVAAEPGIAVRAWQATAAQLAAHHHSILGEHRQLAPLNMFFRCARRLLCMRVCVCVCVFALVERLSMCGTMRCAGGCARAGGVL
jgi:CRP-like cAMP-binding protein